MKLTKAQLEALQQGVDMATVLSMATTAPSGNGPAQEEIDAVVELNAQLTTVNAEKEALATQLAAAIADKETLTAQLAELTTESETATADAATLRGIVVDQVTKLSIAAGSKFDASELNASDLVAKHAEMTAAVTEKFKNVPLGTTKPGVATETKKPIISESRLAKAAKFPIV